MQKIFKSWIALICVFIKLTSIFCPSFAVEANGQVLNQKTQTEAERETVYRKGLELILATGDSENITLPDEDSYLKNPEVKYVNAEHKNSIKSYRKPWRNQSALGAYPYHGMKVLVVAKQDEYDCIVFKDNNTQSQVAWVHDEELTWYYPGEERTVGVPCVKFADNIGDAEVSWSEKSFDGSRQKYTILSEPAVNCVQFTLDYQVIGRGGAGVDDILGDRIIYVSDGTEWIEIGRFPYDEIEALHVVVNLEEPMRLAAVATTADCKKPDAFLFRQSVQDVLTAETERTRHDSGDYSYTLLEDGTAEIISYHGTDHVVEFPAVLDGHPVTTIGSEVLHDKVFTYIVATETTEIIIPDSVTTIGDRAFEDCFFLKSVTIPDSVTRIGNKAFSYCDNLEKIIIPDSVTAIGDGAFSWTGLKCIAIPDSVQEVGTNPFAYCSELSDIIVSKTHPFLQMIDEVLFSRADGRLICCPNTFASTHYSIPDGTVIIGDRAFYGCEELSSITIPASVTNIGSEAFNGCEGLENITIPDSVMTIGDGAFSRTDLKYITLPDSVKVVGNNPFLSCDNLAEITVSDNHPFLTTIDGVLFSKTDNRLICFPQASLITDYSIPMGTRIVGDSAFEACKTLNSITIPNSVIKIGKSAFSDCHLRSITLPGSVTVIDDNAFSGNFDLKHIEIPKGVKKIGDAAFSWCIMLEDVNIPDSVETMGDSVFHHCSRLEKASIPASIRRIGCNPFANCQNLKWLNFPWDHPYLTLIINLATKYFPKYMAI